MTDFWAVSKDRLITEFQTDPSRGLSADEASRRLAKFGLNQLPPPQSQPWLRLIWRQLANPIVLILILAATITLSQQQLADTFVIFAVVIANTVIGFYQESSAERVISKLHGIIAPTAKVIRAADVQKIPSRLLVVGDIIKVESGDRVPADCRLIHCQSLAVNQASLTGESAPVHKRDTIVAATASILDQDNMIFASTLVTSGQATAVVVKTGQTTELGQIAASLKTVASPRLSPLESQLRSLSRWLTGVALVLAGLIFIVGLSRGLAPLIIFETTLAVLVSIVPEGLLIVLTVILSIGLKRLYRHRVLVRQLTAVETLGSVTVLALDKTGTLTEGAMMVEKILLPEGEYRVTGQGFGLTGSFYQHGEAIKLKDRPQLQTLLEMTCLTTSSTVTKADLLKDRARQLTDPTETALAAVAAKAGFYAFERERQHPELLELPFDQEKRFSASIHRFGARNRVIVKGAFEQILERSDALLADKSHRLLALSREKWRRRAEELAAEGYRVVALAYVDCPVSVELGPKLINHLTLVGLLALDDPVRLDARQTISQAHSAGIRTMMITGDHLLTASHIARKLGLDQFGQVIHAQDLGHADLSKVSVIARATPQDKLVIVERLQKMGAVVAMTGDGVNDAPALAKADVGVALGRIGTDIAVEAADIVLQDDHIQNLWLGVTEGRLVGANIKKVIYYLVSTNLSEVLVVMAALAFGWSLPLVAVQILWLNLVTDGVTSTALAAEPPELAEVGDVLPPITHALFDGATAVRMLTMAGVMAIGALLVYGHFQADPALAQTATLTTLVFFQLFNLFNSRSMSRSLLSIKSGSNPLLWTLFSLAIGLQLAAVYWPPLADILGLTAMNLPTLLLCSVVAVTIIIADELYKFIRAEIISWAKTQVRLN